MMLWTKMTKDGSDIVFFPLYKTVLADHNHLHAVCYTLKHTILFIL